MEPKEQSIEEMIVQLEQIMQKMQQKEVSLEEAFALYQSGVEKLKSCHEKIDAVEKKLLILNEEGQLV